MTSHAATTSDVSTSGVSQKKPWYKVLYVQVLIAILVGAIFGWLEPTYATNDWIKALGEGFIKLIKMVIAPVLSSAMWSGPARVSAAAWRTRRR
jgi:aerobic C4-dicarboxylate transport protein